MMENVLIHETVLTLLTLYYHVDKALEMVNSVSLLNQQGCDHLPWNWRIGICWIFYS